MIHCKRTVIKLIIKGHDKKRLIRAQRHFPYRMTSRRASHVPSLNERLDHVLNMVRLCTHNFRHLLSILEQHEGWHGVDVELLGHLFDLGDIDAVELDLGVCVAPFLENRGNGLAGTTPIGVAIEDHWSL